MTETNFLGVIPARYASSRLPGKPLLEICGRTMLEHVYRRALLSDVFSRLIIATDDERIYDAAQKFNAEVMMTRSDHTDGTSRIAEVAEKFDADYVINIQGDEPLLDPRMLRELAQGFAADKGADSATVCIPIRHSEDFENPNIVKVVRALDGHALYFSRSPIPYPRNDTGCNVYEHLGIYAFTKDFLMKLVKLSPTPLMQTESLEQLRILEHGYTMAVIVTKYPSHGPNVNTPEDIEEVRRIMAAEK
ncbi:MAG: 3-deoxy-manno-octulosonate cytidylyltransferase [Synergistes sp.]|nr:3-deoxy-manno-octulosonate cytidylyltransferase [Synergistes sp.]